MRYLFYSILIVVVIMSLAAGGAKVAAMPQEVQFFEDAGIVSAWLLPFGAMQIIGGLLAIYHRSRRAGLAVIALGFLLSSILIFATGNVAFGFVSLLPVLLCIFVLRQSGAQRQ